MMMVMMNITAGGGVVIRSVLRFTSGSKCGQAAKELRVPGKTIITMILMARTRMVLMMILILTNKPPGNEQHSNSRPVLPMLEVRSVKPW